MNNYKVAVSHPFGNQNLRAVLRGFKDKDILEAYITSIGCFPNTALYNIASRVNALADIKRRGYEEDLKSLTKTSESREIIRLLSTKFGFKKLITQETGLFSVDRMCHYIDKKTSNFIEKNTNGNLKAVYAYEDVALESFKVCKENGLMSLYDLPIGYWRAARKLMKEEINNRPEWANTMLGFNDSQEKLARKDKELAFADHIFVASTFTANTLKDYPGKLTDISVIPYGFPPAVEYKKYSIDDTKPLKVLFVGGLSQRKGIANLFEAVNHFGKKRIQLTVVGREVGDNESLKKELANCNYIRSMPNYKILELMRTQDVFVFPSLFEGFGLVITEAMSQGVPVITTERTCGLDIIKNNENGWIIEAGKTETLINVLDEILSNRVLLKLNGSAALETAKKRTWEDYSMEVADKVKMLINT